MSELRKTNTDSAYFITFTVMGWGDVFTRSEYKEIIIVSGLNWLLEQCDEALANRSGDLMDNENLKRMAVKSGRALANISHSGNPSDCGGKTR